MWSMNHLVSMCYVETMENLAIVQHWDRLHYAIILGGGYRLQIRRFEQIDYVYLQQITLTTLDVITKHVILHVRKVLPSRVFVAKRPRQSNMEKLCAQLCTMSSSQCGWPNWPTLIVVLISLWHTLCGQASRAAIMFSRLVYGMPHATNGGNVNWQMVFTLVHPIDLGS
jgi:hypothetical protein